MQNFVIVEIVIFFLSIPFILYFASSSLISRTMIASAFVSIAFEIINELVFPFQGTYYPDSLFFFPYFKFPVAIVLLSVFYAGIINILALKISGLFINRFMSVLLFFISIFILNLTSITVENTGIISGYWIHRKAVDISSIHGFVYLFYLLIVLAGSVFVVTGFLKKFKKSDQHF